MNLTFVLRIILDLTSGNKKYYKAMHLLASRWQKMNVYVQVDAKQYSLLRQVSFPCSHVGF